MAVSVDRLIISQCSGFERFRRVPGGSGVVLGWRQEGGGRLAVHHNTEYLTADRFSSLTCNISVITRSTRGLGFRRRGGLEEEGGARGADGVGSASFGGSTKYKMNQQVGSGFHLYIDCVRVIEHNGTCCRMKATSSYDPRPG